MTVALVLAAQADAGLRGQLTALGVRRIDAADRGVPGLLAIAAAARAAGERVLIFAGDALPEESLARLLAAGRTAVFTGTPPRPGQAGHGGGALVVDTPDLGALAGAAEFLADVPAAPPQLDALLGELTRRGVSVLVLDPGPDGDGAVAQLIGEPVARDVALWAAGRQLGPASLYGISLGLGLLSAVWFSEPATRTQVLGIVVLLASFAAGRAGAQLAAVGYDGPVRPAVDWLGGACGMLTELAVYAALAVSAGLAGPGSTGQATGLHGIFGAALQGTPLVSWGGAGQAGVWRLAVAAILLLGARRLAEVCFEGLARASGTIPARPVRGILGQVITLPAGERIAVIAVTAVFFGPRLTFLALLACGAAAAGYLLAGQLAASARMTRAGGELAAYRDDGAISYRLGGLVRGQLPPLPPLVVGLLVTCDLAVLGLANLPGVLILTPVAAMLLAALGARHPHGGRADWLVPPLLLAGEGIFLAALGFSRHVWLPVIFALLAAVVTRHADIAYRARSGRPVRRDAFGLGWDGRMLLAGLAAVGGIVPFACAVLAAWLWLLAAWDFLGAWLNAAGAGLVTAGAGLTTAGAGEPADGGEPAGAGEPAGGG
jgi:hypothetical protein